MWKRAIEEIYPLVWIYGFWVLLPFITGSSATLSVVLSDSMFPQTQRGDILFAVGPDDLGVGEIVLFKLPHRVDNIPIVHRIIKVIDENTFLTKGDFNTIDDRGLYYPSFKYLPRSAIIGKVRGQIPYIGYLAIYLQEYKLLTYTIVLVYTLHNIWNEKKRPTLDWTSSKWSTFKFLLYPV